MKIMIINLFVVWLLSPDMWAINYLATNENGQEFLWDKKLSFSPKQHFQIGKYEWRPFVEAGDYISKEWHDLELEVSDIPPSLLLLGIHNAYSFGLSSYVGIDYNFEKFSRMVAQEFKDLQFVDIVDTRPFHLRSRVLPHPIEFDVKHLHQTGKIKSSAQWNRSMAKAGFVSTFGQGDDQQAPPWTSVGTIQGIIQQCRRLMHELNVQNTPKQ